MQLKSPLRYGRRQLWLPALALAAVAVAGCSSSGGGTASAAPPTTPAATAPTAPTPAGSTPTGSTPTGATAPTASVPAPTAAGTPTAAPAAARPADACTLLASPQVVAAVGTAGPFRGTHPDPASDGSPVWGCTWGSRESYASIRETSPTALASARADAELQVTPLPGVGQDAVLTQRKDGTHPRVLFLAGGRVYAVEVLKDRGPGDGVNAPAEVLAESGLAMVLAKQLGG